MGRAKGRECGDKRTAVDVKGKHEGKLKAGPNEKRTVYVNGKHKVKSKQVNMKNDTYR